MKIDLKKYRKKYTENGTPYTSNKKKDRKGVMVSWLFLSPSVIGVLTFFLVPFLIVIFYSLTQNPPVHYDFVGLNNYTSVINNVAFHDAAVNTAIFSAIAVPLAVIIPLLLAMLLDTKIPFKSQFRSFFLTPLMVPVASVVLVWQVVFHYNGLANEIIQKFGVESIEWFDSEYAHLVILILFLWKNIGYNMILFIAALGSVPGELLEAASLERCGYWRMFFSIKFRYIVSTMVFVTIMSLINSFKVFREIYLLKGAHPTSYMYMLQTFMNNKFDSLDYNTLSAAAILMSLVMVVIIGILFFAENRLGKDIES